MAGVCVADLQAAGQAWQSVENMDSPLNVVVAA